MHGAAHPAPHPAPETAPRPTMSYGYGPTVVYPPSGLPMDSFGGGYEAKENYSAGLQSHAGKAGSQGSRPALANLSNAGCCAEASGEASGLFVFEGCAGAREQQVASTSARAPLAERNTTTRSSQASKRSSQGVLPARQQPTKREPWVDIDAQNRDNPLACSEYAESIFQYLNTCELLNRPNPQYLSAVQEDTTPHMRCILVDWLVEVAQEYRLTSDTLHLTVNLLDRFLSLAPVPREELQLAGIACMWAASKFEEIYAPSARSFCYITDNTYDQAQLVDMEARLLAALEFRLAVPTAKTFQRRYLQAAAADARLHYLAAFLLELSLMDEGMLVHVPSQVAAASLYVANAMLGRRPWDATLAHYSRYREQEVLPVARQLAAAHARILSRGEFSAVREKYSCDKLLRVAEAAPCARLLSAEAYEAAVRALCGTASSDGSGSGDGSSSSGGASSSDGSSDMELL